MVGITIRKRLFGSLGAIIAVLASSASAQQGIVPDIPGVPNFAGVGIGVINEYEGADEFTFGALPLARVSFEDRYLFLQGNTLFGNILNSPTWRFGPIASYRFGRKNVEDDFVDRLNRVSDAIELGAFGGFQLVNSVNPRYRLLGNVQFLHDVSDSHNGFTVRLFGRYWFPVFKFLSGSLGLSSGYGSDDFMDTYFGIDQGNSLQSGLPPFKASSGIKDISVTPGVVVHFSEAWHLGIGMRYRRLLGDAADSPITDQRGTPNQFAAGLGLVYAW